MQGDLFTQTGEQLKEKGMQQAIDHADKENEGQWSEMAYNFLCSYLTLLPAGSSFMVEEVRQRSLGIVPPPPSLRAWGGIIVKAKTAKLIQSAGIKQVKNPQAHMANAAVWRKL